MTSKPNKECVELIDEMRRAVMKNGVKKTVEALKSIKNIKDDTHLVIKCCIDLVLKEKEWSVFSRKKLFTPNIRWEAIVARDTILILVKEATGLLPREISPYVGGVSPNVIRAALRTYNRLDRANSIDKKTVERTERLLEEVNKFKNKKIK